ncbi:MAG: hypothetical protein HY608_00530 [Planctomycetes bacterium]|nr:hypothetical protein [Planctomycetota bacterium]
MTGTRVVACVEVDPAAGPLGLRERHGEPILGKPAVRHVLEALGRCRTVQETVLTSVSSAGIDRAWIEGLTVRTLIREFPDIPDRPWLRRARLWARDSWRGGLFWTTAFDEEGRPGLMHEAATSSGADLLVRVPATAVWLDPGRLDRLVEHHLRISDTFEVAFTKAPPGLAPESYTVGVLAKMARLGRTPREMFAYRPDDPVSDPAKKPCALHLPEAVVRTPLRLLADTRRGRRLAERLADRGLRPGEARDEEIASAIGRAPSLEFADGPRAILVEAIREEAGNAPAHLTEDGFARALPWFGSLDDITVTLGGGGEPMRHPSLPAWVRRARQAGALGIAVQSRGEGDDAAWEALLEAAPDLVEIRIDATDDEEGPSKRARWILERAPKEKGGPLLVVSREKRIDREERIEPFVDDWLARGAWPVIRPTAAYAGARSDLSPVRLLPAERHACLRLRREICLRADGRWGVCSMDLAGALPSPPVCAGPEAWQTSPLASLRDTHLSLAWDRLPRPCQTCLDWDRTG